MSQRSAFRTRYRLGEECASWAAARMLKTRPAAGSDTSAQALAWRCCGRLSRSSPAPLLARCRHPRSAREGATWPIFDVMVRLLRIQATAPLEANRGFVVRVRASGRRWFAVEWMRESPDPPAG